MVDLDDGAKMGGAGVCREGRYRWIALVTFVAEKNSYGMNAAIE